LIAKDGKHSLNFSFLNWKNLVLLALFAFYLIVWGNWLIHGDLYQNDYLAFWSAGKVANEQGFSRLYDLEALKTAQMQGLESVGLLKNADRSAFMPNPAPIFPVFVLPFQCLAKIDLRTSYWLWTLMNLALLLGYLLFFTRKICPSDSGPNVLLLMLAAFPLFYNLVQGQVDIFLAVCAGEFLRQAIRKKPFLSGLWLGGLLLKPQSLILVLPLFLLLRYWKPLLGFLATAGLVLISSVLLAGSAGLESLILLWTRFAGGFGTSAPGAMINWRMIAVSLNDYLPTSLSWWIAGLGMALTLVAALWLVKARPEFGTSAWVLMLLGLFSATLALTWHTHYQMALVLEPFLIYAAMHRLMSEKIIFAWATTTSLLWMVLGAGSLILFFITHTYINNYERPLIPFSGFVVNLMLLVAIMIDAEKHRKFSASDSRSGQLS
jgi:Protein of unknown function (DUF2029).